MGWTPLYLKMDHYKVLIVGAGEVGLRRAERFLQAGAEIIITGGTVPPDKKKIDIKEKPLEELESLIKWADLVVIASGDPDLNQKTCSLAGKKLINRADIPDEGNVIVPSSFFIGDVQICIFTQGKSPLMSRQLRKKIQKVIKPEDVMQLEVQHYARQLLKEKIKNQKKRRDLLYQILKDQEIKELLVNGELEESKKRVDVILENQK
jgi:precorrin-2 dehydrogenase/sirohydrochlorin ferrochelatase